MRGRFVRQLVCGDFHTLALVEGILPNDIRLPDQAANNHLNVFAWGENISRQITGYDYPARYEKPVLVASLVGKSIVGIDARVNQSICFDENGICYEWGTLTKSDGILGKRRIDGLKKLQLGNGFRLGLSNSGDVYFWGTVKDGSREIFTTEEPIKVSRSYQLVDISVGYDHALAVDSNQEVSKFQPAFLTSKLYGFGNNSSCESGMQASLRDVKTFELCKTLRGEQIKKFWALRNLSMVQTESETLFFGKYGQDKIAKVQQDFAIGDGCQIQKITYCGSQVYALSQ